MPFGVSYSLLHASSAEADFRFSLTIDTKSDVKKAARASLTKLCALVSNKDIEKFIPALM